MAKYIARSASDKTDDWPFWMLWDGHKNVTGPVLRARGIDTKGAVFLTRDFAEHFAAEAVSFERVKP